MGDAQEGITNKIINGKGFVWFYGISTIVGYIMPNPFYTYIYIRYMISEQIL